MPGSTPPASWRSEPLSRPDPFWAQGSMELERPRTRDRGRVELSRSSASPRTFAAAERRPYGAGASPSPSGAGVRSGQKFQQTKAKQDDQDDDRTSAGDLQLDHAQDEGVEGAHRHPGVRPVQGCRRQAATDLHADDNPTQGLRHAAGLLYASPSATLASAQVSAGVRPRVAGTTSRSSPCARHPERTCTAGVRNVHAGRDAPRRSRLVRVPGRATLRATTAETTHPETLSRESGFARSVAGLSRPTAPRARGTAPTSTPIGTGSAASAAGTVSAMSGRRPLSPPTSGATTTSPPRNLSSSAGSWNAAATAGISSLTSVSALGAAARSRMRGVA